MSRTVECLGLLPLVGRWTVDRLMVVYMKGANKAQERAQTLAHGHPWDLGCFLVVILLSLLHAGSCGVKAFKRLIPGASSCR